jgi:hypothetical protein
MKSKTRDSEKRIAAFVLGILALLLTGRWILSSESSGPVISTNSTTCETAITARTSKMSRHTNSFDPTLHCALLESTENEDYEGSGRNIFSAYIEDEPKKIPPTPPPVPPAPSGQLTSPGIWLRFFGFATAKNFPQKCFFYQDGDVFIADEGSIVNRRYKIVRIGSTSVDLEDLLEKKPYTLTLQP